MTDYEKLAADVTDRVIRHTRMKAISAYLLNNWIAIVALIVAIIALFK